HPAAPLRVPPSPRCSECRDTSGRETLGVLKTPNPAPVADLRRYTAACQLYKSVPNPRPRPRFFVRPPPWIRRGQRSASGADQCFANYSGLNGCQGRGGAELPASLAV